MYLVRSQALRLYVPVDILSEAREKQLRRSLFTVLAAPHADGASLHVNS